jgi:HPt (histidine-containing phosphotransfer) domain-containing protein
MPELNIKTLAGLSEFMAPAELRQFLAQVEQELAAAWAPLAQARGLGDSVVVKKTVHRLKSVVGSVGCDRLFALLDALEGRLRSQVSQLPSDAEWAEIESAWAAARQDLHQASRGQ